MLWIIFIIIVTANVCRPLTLMSWKNCDATKTGAMHISGRVVNGALENVTFNFTQPLEDWPALIHVTYSPIGKAFTNLTSIPIKKACSDMNNMPGNPWGKMMASIGVQHPTRCPIAKGVYFVKHFDFNATHPQWIGLPKGFIEVFTYMYSMDKKHILNCTKMVYRT